MSRIGKAPISVPNGVEIGISYKVVNEFPFSEADGDFNDAFVDPGVDNTILLLLVFTNGVNIY